MKIAERSQGNNSRGRNNSFSERPWNASKLILIRVWQTNLPNWQKKTLGPSNESSDKLKSFLWEKEENERERERESERYRRKDEKIWAILEIASLSIDQTRSRVAKTRWQETWEDSAIKIPVSANEQKMSTKKICCISSETSEKDKILPNIGVLVAEGLKNWSTLVREMQLFDQLWN